MINDDVNGKQDMRTVYKKILGWTLLYKMNKLTSRESITYTEK